MHYPLKLYIGKSLQVMIQHEGDTGDTVIVESPYEKKKHNGLNDAHRLRRRYQPMITSTTSDDGKKQKKKKQKTKLLKLAKEQQAKLQKKQKNNITRATDAEEIGINDTMRGSGEMEDYDKGVSLDTLLQFCYTYTQSPPRPSSVHKMLEAPIDKVLDELLNELKQSTAKQQP